MPGTYRKLPNNQTYIRAQTPTEHSVREERRQIVLDTRLRVCCPTHPPGVSSERAPGACLLLACRTYGGGAAEAGLGWPQHLFPRAMVQCVMIYRTV